MSFIKFLVESRKNPEQNPKISAYEYLKQYKDNPNIYISFTDVDKIGLNPNSGYNTPMGIYSYPLKEIWNQYNIDYSKTLTKLPFAADRPYIWVLECTSKNFVNDMYKDYTSANIDKDFEILEKIWQEEYQNIPTNRIFISYDFETELGFETIAIMHVLEALESYKEHIKHFQLIYQSPNYTLERIVSMVNKMEFTDGFVEAYDADNKDGEGQAYIKVFNKHKEKLNELLQQAEEHKRVVMWHSIVNNAKVFRKEQNPIMMFWNLTRLMSLRLTDSVYSTTTWNTLMRTCGYSGFADKSGRGYIHEYEPIQAVFFSRSAFKVVDKILNKDYKIKKIDSLSNMLKIWNELSPDKVLEFFVNYNAYYAPDGTEYNPWSLTNNGEKITPISPKLFAKNATIKEWNILVKKLYNFSPTYAIKLVQDIQPIFITDDMRKQLEEYLSTFKKYPSMEKEEDIKI